MLRARRNFKEESCTSARFVAIVCIAIFSGIAMAQQYPTRPIRILIPFTPGSAGCNIAAELMVKSPADGYTLLLSTLSIQSVNISLYSKLNYHPQRDMTPVTLIRYSPNALVLNPSVPAKSVKELIALARARPGMLNYSSSGAGTTVHLSGVLFGVMTGTNMLHVPFKGAAEALTALISGQTELQFASISSAIPLIKGGRVRALGVTSPRRSPSMPELPTIAE
jgi:tripartite-type tricarboxylate transporter receptor subunit TctC